MLPTPPAPGIDAVPAADDAHRAVRHRRIRIDDVEIFYREAGPADAPVVLLPHGYPCSSYEFRNLMPLLGDRWRLIAPDFPGTGYSDTPERFDYDFDGYTNVLESFLAALQVERFALYLHDFGSQIGLRLAMRDPSRIAALIVQNGDIYEDTLGTKYEALQAFWTHPTPSRRAKIADAITEDGFEDEFRNGAGAAGDRLPPDLWVLHWSLMTPTRCAIALNIILGLRDNLAWFPRYQAYLREHRPPTLIVWGRNDGYMPEAAARAYLRDLPDAELHVFDAGHWLLETHLHEVARLMREFLSRVHGS